jgi:hypothetical protein
MKNVLSVFSEAYKSDKKEFFGSIVFIVLWCAMVYASLLIGSLE